MKQRLCQLDLPHVEATVKCPENKNPVSGKSTDWPWKTMEEKDTIYHWIEPDN